MSAETIFTIFCLECYKQYRHLTGKTVSKLFKDYGVYGYLNEFYDVLHTTGSSYINNDIDIFLKARGCALSYDYFRT